MIYKYFLTTNLKFVFRESTISCEIYLVLESLLNRFVVHQVFFFFFGSDANTKGAEGKNE